MYISDETGEQMPMWCPPTPPHDENDVYIDQTICFLYEPSVMPESHLPPVYVKREHKRIRVDPVLAGRHHKHKGVRKDDQPKVPRSLFDRGSFAALRRDNKPLKIKPGYGRPFHKPPPPIMSRPVMDATSDSPEWLIHEDWALLQCIQSLQELPLQLMTNSPAHIPNWDLVADVVNASSRTYRSAKQCRMRYESVIVPREEGRILYDMNPRKQKKTKGIYKVYATKNNRAMKTSQLFTQDNNGSISTLHTFRFDSCKGIAAKRTPTLRPTLVNPTLKNPKHTAVLAESGINYEQPLNPIQVAQIRADRIAKEKKQSQQAAAAAAEQQQAQQQQQQQQAQQQQQQQQQQQLAAQRAQAAVAAAQVAAQVATTNVVVTTTTAPQMAIVQGQQLTPVTTATTTVLTGAIQKAQVGSAMTAVSLARSLGASSIVVNTPGGVGANQLATFKRIPGQTVVGAVPQSTATVAALTQAVRTAPRTTTTQALTVQEISAAVAANPTRVTTATASATTTQVINTATLTQAQLVAAQRSASAATGSTVQQQLTQQTTTRTLTPAQLSYLKAQALIKQQQQQQLRQQQQQKQLTPEQLKQQQQQIRRIQAAQAGQTIVATQAVTGGTVTPVIAATAVQKTVTGGTPLITSVTPATVAQAARIQTAKPATMKQTAVARPINDADVQAFLKRQQVALQQKVPTQIIAGTQLQQVRAASVQGSAAGQPVATLVKAVPTTQASANLPSMTIPVSLHNVNISVSMPGQQKIGTAAGKQLTQAQLQRLQLQQMQRKTGTQQFATQQKVATLGQVQQVTKTQLAGTPLSAVQIIQQQQQPKLPQAVTVQQFQQIVKQQQAAQQGSTPTIQQIITSVGPATTTTATVIATQLVSQASAGVGGQSVTRMSVPTATITTASAQPSRTGSIATTIAAVPTSAIAVVTTQQPTGIVGTQASSSSLPTVTLTQQQAQQAQHQTVTLTQTQQPAVVKHVQEVIMSPQRTTIPIQSSTGVVGQLKSLPQGGQVRQVATESALQQATVRQVAVSGTGAAGVAGVTIHQVPAITTPTGGTPQQVKSTQSIALQQAVQQVQAHAQAQQQTQQRQHVLQAVSGASLPASAVGATVTTTLSTQGTPVVAAPVAGGAIASTLQQGTQQSVPGAQSSPAAGDQTKPQYSLRLRNQPSKQ